MFLSKQQMKLHAFKNLISGNMKCPKHKIWPGTLSHVLDTFIKLCLISSYNTSLLAFTPQIRLESETEFSMTGTWQHLKKFNGYRKDFCPEKLQWGKQQLIWFSKEIFCLCFTLSSPHPFHCSSEICKNRIHAHKQDEMIMAWQVIPG